MRQVVLDALPAADVLVMAAAVADFRTRVSADRKLTRDAAMTLELEPTEDILAEAAAAARASARPPVLVGFAAETGSLGRAAEKLGRKGVDLLVANDVSEPDSGFGTETNRVTILDAAGGHQELPLLTKREVADLLLDRVVALLDERGAREQTSEMETTRA
jgi:phosphopantothenoylcysteine decarboxylase/phosphopantothenate--cysteine ligase